MTAESRDPELAERLAVVVGAMSRRLRPHGAGLSFAALSALASIARKGAVRPGDLARLEGTGAPGVTRLLGELEQRGYVERDADPEDRRSVLVRITATGNAAVLEARRARAAGVTELLEGCGEDDLVAVERALDVLERALVTTAPDERRASQRA